jgi:hypothetical protein
MAVCIYILCRYMEVPIMVAMTSLALKRVYEPPVPATGRASWSTGCGRVASPRTRLGSISG